jgi:hypothetical protein
LLLAIPVVTAAGEQRGDAADKRNDYRGETIGQWRLLSRRSDLIEGSLL